MTRIAHIDEAGCPWVSHQLSRYLDGELSVSASSRVHEHLAACTTCRRAFEEEAALLVLTVDQLVDAEPSEELEGHLVTALAAERDRITVLPQAPRTAGAVGVAPIWRSAAAAVLLFALAWFLTNATTDAPIMETPADVIEVAVLEPVESIMLPEGDLDGDGSAGLHDLELLARYMTEDGVSLPCERAADVDEDGTLTICDVFAVAHEQLYATTELESFGTDRAHDELPCDLEVACL